MITKTTFALATLALVFTPMSSRADDVEEFVNRLKGNFKSGLDSRLSDTRRQTSATQSTRETPSYLRDNRNQDTRVSSSNDRYRDDRSSNSYDRNSYDRGRDSRDERVSSSSRSSRSTSSTRTLNYDSSHSVPTSVRRAASENRVDLDSARGGGMELSYCVDCDSKISRDDILFRKGSTEFADRYSYEIVRDLAYAMQDRRLRGMQFVVEGHASAEGSYASNMRLSQRRADRIVSEMIRLGVNHRALIAVGYGESEATYDAYAPEHLRSNDRRVVVYRMD